jgi:hypothetical protein
MVQPTAELGSKPQSIIKGAIACPKGHVLWPAGMISKHSNPNPLSAVKHHITNLFRGLWPSPKHLLKENKHPSTQAKLLIAKPAKICLV